jgi:glycosyltransferase involved in cell wall biosynthesis
VRIALVDPGAYSPPYDDGLAASLAARGHEVSLLTAPFRFGEIPRAHRYHREELFFRISGSLFRGSPRSSFRLPVKMLEYAPGTRRLRSRLDELDPDVVHLQWLVYRPGVDVRWLRAIARRRPTVFTAHDLGSMLDDRPEAWRRVFDAVDRVVVHARRSVEELVALGLSSDRVVRIPHPALGPVDLPDPTRRIATTILFFGLIRSYKGIDVLLRALPRIIEEVPDTRLIVAGDPFDPVASSRHLAERLGVADRVEWQLGFQANDRVDALMAAADIVALPYRRRVDSSGVLATALGYGRPLVVSDVGNLGETVEEFGAGEVVPPGDHGSLATACVRLLTDVEVRDRAVRGSLEARRTLTWDRSAALHEELYGAIGERRIPSG